MPDEDDAITPSPAEITQEPVFTSPDDEPAEAEIAPEPTTEEPVVDPDAPEIDPEPGEPELIEVEFDGETYSVPRTLEKALLRQADYTQKTQAVAESTKAVEARESKLAEWATAINDDRQEHAQLDSIDGQLKQYDEVDWATLRMDDPDEWTVHRERVNDLRYARTQLVGQMQSKHAERTAKAEAEMVTLRDTTRSAIAKEIPNSSPKLETDLIDFGVQRGFGKAEVEAIFNRDPRMVGVLHLAFEMKRLASKQRAIATKPEVEAKPLRAVKTTGKTSQGSALPRDSDSIDVWMKKEEARARRKAAKA